MHWPTTWGVSAYELSPSAAVAVTLLPGSIDAYTDGYVVILSESSTNGEAQAVRLRKAKGRVMCDFDTHGVQCGIVFHTRH